MKQQQKAQVNIKKLKKLEIIKNILSVITNYKNC